MVPAVGRIALYVATDGKAYIGAIEQIEDGHVVQLRSHKGLMVDVERGARGWAWNEKYAMTARHAMIEGKFKFKNPESALWTLVHKRKRLIERGIISVEK